MKATFLVAHKLLFWISDEPGWITKNVVLHLIQKPFFFVSWSRILYQAKLPCFGRFN